MPRRRPVNLPARVLWFLVMLAFPTLVLPSAEEVNSEDIRVPGPDLANFPNSAFVAPHGMFLLEMTPVFYTGESSHVAQQYNLEYLLRYGLFGFLEIRLYSQGFSVQGKPEPAVGFSPLVFDTKLQFRDEGDEFYLPAVGLEVLLQTTWLSSPAFNGGTEPSFSLNLDKTLPFDLEVEVNVGAARFENPDDVSERVWDFTFSWALQREVIPDFAVFVNGYNNSANLPRAAKLSDVTVTGCPAGGACLPTEQIEKSAGESYKQQVLGAGVIWTVNDHLALFANAAGGLTAAAPSVVAYLGFAWTP